MENEYYYTHWNWPTGTWLQEKLREVKGGIPVEVPSAPEPECELDEALAQVIERHIARLETIVAEFREAAAKTKGGTYGTAIL